MKRRAFILKSAMAGLAVSASGYPFSALANNNDFVKITLLHTNDTHSRIDPFPSGSKYAGMGGTAKRASIINQIRKEEKNVLLVDAGDIFQGTPYFNVYGGELEFKLMSQMQYDAATLGNHDFDAGVEGLVKQLPHASFDFVNCNYLFNETPLENKINQFKIFEKEGVRIGITGVGIELAGLVPDNLFGKIKYENPIKKLNETALFLKNEKKCDLIICLSHLGYEYSSKKISDKILAANSENVHIIIGGHTHTFLDKPMKVNNLKNEPVIINQVGWAGLQLGRLDVFLDKYPRKIYKKNAPEIFSKKTIVK